MPRLHKIGLSLAIWPLAGVLAFAGGVAVQLPQQPGDCPSCVATFPHTAGGRGR